MASKISKLIQIKKKIKEISIKMNPDKTAGYS
jgi:hypothetical protein